MSLNAKVEWFEGIETVVSDPLRFKAKLAIGEEAYTSLRVKNVAFELWDTAGAASTAMTVAKSSVIASKFFAPSGVLTFFGIGSAVTPVGWVIAAGIIAGGGWFGLTRYLKQSTNSRVTIIPDFINTPMDVLALGLFDLMGPLSFKVASIDGNIDTHERDAISRYFVKEWGYSPEFVLEGMTFIENRLEEFSVKGLAQSLGEFQKHNKDCNFKAMSKELVGFLREIMEADGRIDEREEMAIERVQAVFEDVAKFKFMESAQKGIDKVAGVAKGSVDMASDLAKSGAGKLSGIARKVSEMNAPVKKD